MLFVAVPRVSAQAPPPPSPLTLQQAVTYAVANYPAIHASAARVAAQEAGVDLAETSYLPRLDSTLQINRATRNNVAGLLLPGAPIPSISGPVSDSSPTSIWGSAGGLLLSWELFDFGARGASVDVARHQMQRASATAELTRVDVAVRTADAYLRLAVAQETVRAARANVARMDVFANAVSVLVKNQLRAGADDSRAQAELSVARIQLIQAEQAEEIARAGFAQWIGVDPDEVRMATVALLDAPPTAPSVALDAERHPAAVGQRAAVDASQAAQNAIGRAYFPRFSFQTAFSARGTGATANGALLSGSSGLGWKTSNWATGVTATFPLFDRFSLQARKAIEEQNEQAESASYDRVVREIGTQARQARAEMNGARRIAAQTPVQLASARVLEQQSRARYDAGLGTIVEVADAARLLLQAEVGDAVAKFAVWRALVADAAARGDITELLK
jgi:outer membrane protein TolC